MARGRISRFPIDLRRRPYNTLALPCECVNVHSANNYKSTVSLSLTLSLSLSRCIWFSQYHNVSILDFIGAKDDGDGGDIWSYKMCKTSVKSSLPTNQHPASFTGQMPFLSPNQQRQSTEGKYKYNINFRVRSISTKTVYSQLYRYAPLCLQVNHLPGSVNEYQLQLGRQRQVWLIPIADERVTAQAKL